MSTCPSNMSIDGKAYFMGKPRSRYILCVIPDNVVVALLARCSCALRIHAVVGYVACRLIVVRLCVDHACTCAPKSFCLCLIYNTVSIFFFFLQKHSAFTSIYYPQTETGID